MRNSRFKLTEREKEKKGVGRERQGKREAERMRE
jgi:hypothetical protein